MKQGPQPINPGDAIEAVVAHLTEHPEEALVVDPAAFATLDDALHVTVVGPSGEVVETDMPVALGGRGRAPTPGWLLRAAVASCIAATVGLEATRAGTPLAGLTVQVTSESDDRGFLGIDSSIPPGPLSMAVRIVAEAGAVDSDAVHRLVTAGVRRSPVHDVVGRPVDLSVDITVD